MSRTPEGLPQSLEDAVLAILDGDESARGKLLRELVEKHPEHGPAIRRWLDSCGVTLPGTQHPATEGAATSEPNDSALPQRLGAYVLQAVLGRGGFGTVYRAEQMEPIHRPVAVKVLNPGMDSREILARFSAEREALNRMDHPGIARLLDAGTTPKGRPFFVMELVEGPTLSKYCREHKLPVRARLELFLLVLDAMQHAHQKAVLHRDLSSNNVLVADPFGRPQPKIIDFGIAKSLRDPLLEGGAMTFQGTLMGTPEFMSPEQAAGRVADIDTRADVYALGVQLYELLADQLPIPGVVLRQQGLAGMADVIARHPIVPPSQAVPRDRRPELRGDLDGITGKALAKSRDERYASVGELAADLRHHLADEPVQVVSPTTWYRLRKFVRRHKGQSAAMAVAGLVMLGALGAMLWALSIAHSALASVQAQKDDLAAKADAGFRLLANEERLRAAIVAERALPPPWPEHSAAYTGWLEDHGEPVANEIGKLEERLSALARQKANSPRRAFDDPADQHLENALVRLLAELQAFAGDAGSLGRVRQRLSFLRDVAEPAAAANAEEWQAAIDAITRSDGETANAAYRGVRIPSLSGLVPLGADPQSRLFEFLDLLTHPRGAPPPVRDAASGRLRTDADTGIVFVLVPGGTVRLGARRGDPGMAQNDEDAQDDELQGELATLDEFLLARTELTEGQWARLCSRPLDDRDPLLPVAGIDWNEATAALADADLLLPTEAQWEFACRARTTTPWCTGGDPKAVSSHGWFGPRPQRIGRLQPNGYDLFDMHGNVAEWCRDEKQPYGTGLPRVGDGLRAFASPPPHAPRIVRGGACHQGPVGARSSARQGLAPATRDSAVGIRPVRRLRAGP